MRNLKSTCIAAFAALVLASPALAGELDGAVSRVLDTVTRSTVTQPTLGAFTVTLTNTKPNAMAGVRFIASTGVLDTNGGLTGSEAPYVSVSPAAGVVTCEPTTPAETSISCRLVDPLPGTSTGGNSVTFTVSFRAPTIGGELNYLLRLNWIAVFDESGGGASDGDLGGPETDITLTPASNDKVETYVAVEGTTIQTASTDMWTTSVKVPKLGKATLQEFRNDIGQGCSINPQPGLKDCRVSDLDIPSVILSSCTGDDGTNPCLVITLRRDASTIKKGQSVQIENLSVYYGNVAAGNELPLCPALNPSAFLVGVNKRCIKDRYEITKRTPGATRDDIGDFIWVIWALENGRTIN